MTQPKAMLCALAAFFAWVLVDAAIKLASQAALSPYMIMACLGIIGVAGVTVGAFYKRDLSLLRPSLPREQSFICLCSVLINYANVIALKHLPLTIFYIVVFTAPFVIAALAALLKHEALTKVKIACLIAGFVGVVMAIGPRGGEGGEWIGYIAALASVVGFAGYTLTIQRISHRATSESILFVSFLAVAAFGILGVCLQTAALPDIEALAIIVAGGLINLLGNFLYNKALHGTSSTRVQTQLSHQ